jgi:hypothetical protein
MQANRFPRNAGLCDKTRGPNKISPAVRSHTLMLNWKIEWGYFGLHDCCQNLLKRMSSQWKYALCANRKDKRQEDLITHWQNTCRVGKSVVLKPWRRGLYPPSVWPFFFIAIYVRRDVYGRNSKLKLIITKKCLLPQRRRRIVVVLLH